MIEERLRELGLSLPTQPAPAANYAPFIRVGSLVFISGQLPSEEGELKYIGKVGRDFDVEEGQKAAQLCALNCLAQGKAACEGNLNRVLRCIRLGGFVNSTEEFKDHPQVVNGASNLIVSIMGEKGRHARASVGVNSLPFGCAVEIEAIFEMKD